MTKPDPFAAISRNERAALDDLCGRSVLLSGDVQRIAFLHNASFNRVRSMLPAYRANRAAIVAAFVPVPPAADPPDIGSPLPKIGTQPKPSRWSSRRK